MRMETGENANQHPKLQTLTASIDEFEILLMEDCRDSKLCRHGRTISSFYVDEESKRSCQNFLGSARAPVTDRLNEARSLDRFPTAHIDFDCVLHLLERLTFLLRI